MAASSSYFSSNRGKRSRRNVQATASSIGGSRTPRNLVAARVASSPRSAYMSSQPTTVSNHAAASRHRRHMQFPRTVTPNGISPGPSWEDYEEDPYEIGGGLPRFNRSKAPSSDRSVVSTSYVEGEDDIPLDELIEDNLSVQSMPPIRRTHYHRRARSVSNNDWTDAASNSRSSSSGIDFPINNSGNHRKNQSMDWGNTELGQIGLHRRTSSNLSADWMDDVSSLGGVEDRSNGIGDIIRALKHRSKSRPSHLNAEERILWESIQTALNAARNEQMGNRRALGRLLQDAARREAQIERKLTATQLQLTAMNGNSKSRTKFNHIEVQVRDLENTLKIKQANHEREVRAMQRVLAEMTQERGKETEKLNRKIENLTSSIEKLEKEREEGLDISAESQNNSILDTQLAESKQENEKLVQQMDLLKSELEMSRKASVKSKNKKLEPEMSFNSRSGILPSKSMTPPRHGVSGASISDAESVSSEDVEKLQHSLAETATSLENAKKIIASLESANGSLALDMRSKLKAKEKDLLAAHSESADSKRRLDILATELRALQLKQGESDRSRQDFGLQTRSYQNVVSLLKRSMSGLQSASVVHEASAATGQPDLSNVDQIGEILAGTLTALRSALQTPPVQGEVDHTNDNPSPDGGDQKMPTKRVDEQLQKQNEQIRKLKAQLDSKRNGAEYQQFRAEIQILQDKCSSNEKLLAKKERELAVLQSSLRVDNNDAGYISDDESGDEDEVASGSILPLSSMNYGKPLSLAIGVAGKSSNDQVETLKKELVKALGDKDKAHKELREEKDSLTNAKMIISSLENANKKMTTDLRSRLQDSNSEISVLKEKEHTSNELRQEVERLRKENEDFLQRFKGTGHAKEQYGEEAKTDIEEKKEDSEIANAS